MNIWDFGGQEIYHATHQFFLSKRSLYLLVADTRKQYANFDYWLSVAEMFGGGSPILIIKNEREDINWNIQEQSLKGKFNTIEKVLTTNLKTNSKDFPALKDHLSFYLQQLPHIGTPFPKTWLTIRELLEKDSRNYMSEEEFLTLCEQHGFKTEGDKLQLSETLHDLGSILHFQSNLLLKETIFLKPHWATQAVYHVLDNQKIIDNYGQFTTSDLQGIWSTSEYRYMQAKLRELMLSFKLCYKLRYCDDTYIAPQLLNEDQVDYQWKYDKTVNALYKYKFMPKGLITQLIVALHNLISDQQRCVWRSGVVLEYHQTYAEIIEDYDQREIKIAVAGENCRDLMTVIMCELDIIHAAYEKLTYDILIPCQHCRKLEFTYNDLKRYAKKFRPIECRKCEQDNDAQLLINGIHNPQLSAQKYQKEFPTSENIHINHINNNFNGSVTTAMTGNHATHGDTATGNNAQLNHTETHTQNIPTKKSLGKRLLELFK